MIAVLCNADGQTQLGSDGYLNPDGRLKLENKIEVARQYREGFKKHFKHKYEFWTHVMFVQRINDLPDSYNNRSMPHRYSL